MSDELYIVGIGTSAGGLEALERFFSNMTAHPHLAFVVVQHLSPDYKSHMVELLSKYTSLAVHQATDGAKIEAGNIYLLPPSKNMTIFQKKLYLVDYERGQGINLPIDIMLDSLARDQGNYAIACILSGTGSDGTRGIRAIKEHGGMVLAQDETARFDGMPRSAISTQLVDFVAAPEQMSQIIVRYISHPRRAIQESLKTALISDRDQIGKVLAIIRDKINLDFTGYKLNTLVRRIERRMSLFEMETIDQYIEFLQRNDSERQILSREFLIGVTSFFRDAEAFEFLQSNVIPSIVDNHTRREQIRVWIAGCSTGEEAYSIAILFQEYMEKQGKFVDLKIFATDIDQKALDYAGHGKYPESVLADLPPELLKNYFVKNDDHYEITRHIRSMIVFANHNLITDPPFSRIDLISCRNLLIYLQSDVQLRILSTFQFSLVMNGILFLGSSESLGDKSNDFRVENAKWKIYRYHGTYNSLDHIQMRKTSQRREADVRQPDTKPNVIKNWQNTDLFLRNLVEYILPPCLVVDEKLTLIHAFGEVEPYLRVPRGYQVNLNVLNIIVDNLKLPLSNALHNTFKESRDVTYDNIQLTADDESVDQISISTRVFWSADENQRLALILLKPQRRDDSAPLVTEPYTMTEGVSQRIINLEQELQYTRENLQSTIEELETSNEELQATNEELMAANEELQSTNEELESVNEELLTVNSEYQLKIKELSALNDDMNNLIKSIEIGTLFLDSELNVRKFTPATKKYINVLEEDVGRPISHFAHKFLEFDLINAIEQVLETLVTSEYELQNKTGQWLQLRIVPYRTYTDQINGVVVTMVDITELKTAIAKAESTSEYAQVILDSLSAQIAVIKNDGTIIRVNRAWRRFAEENGGILHRTDIGTNYLDVCSTADGFNTEGAQECGMGLRQLINGNIDEFDMEYPCHSPTEDRWFLLRAVRLQSDEGGIVISHINITDRVKMENAIRRSEKRVSLSTIGQDLALFEHDLTLRYIWIHNTGVPYPHPGMLNRADMDCLTELQAKRLIELKRLCIRTGTRMVDTIDIISEDNLVYMCKVILDPLTNDQGQVTGLIGVFRDFEVID